MSNKKVANGGNVVTGDFNLQPSDVRTSTIQNSPSRRYNGGGGEPPMKADYVTHEELNHAVDNLSNKMDLMQAHSDAKFELLTQKLDASVAAINQKSDSSVTLINQKIDSSVALLDQKISGNVVSLNQKIDATSKITDAKIDAQSKVLWWLMGIVSAGIIIPLLTLLVKTLFFK